MTLSWVSLDWAAIGVIVGLLLGISGAGGAVVAVPLFVYLLDVPVREATVLSLFAVIAGAGLNWIIQWKKTDTQVSLGLFAFSMLGSYLSKPLKEMSPQWLVTALFMSVCALGLASLWKPGATQHKSDLPARLGVRIPIGGIALGFLITMTGLGGGVILIPFLTLLLGMGLDRAAATSLLTIFLSSSFSLWIQGSAISHWLAFESIALLLVGSILSALLTRQLIRNIEPQRLNRVRRALVSIVLITSAISLLFRT